MITVFWKELRENARWASLGFVAVAAALISEWRASPLIFGGGYNPHGQAVQTDFFALASMVAIFTAIALGILQTRRDNRPASRALLLHRGITADTAFVGKLVAGLALYSFAVFVPLLVMAIFIAINGIEHHAASPVSLVPMAWLALTAFGWWPAMLLVVQRDARVFGSRVTPAVTALFAMLLLVPSHDYVVLLVMLLVSLLSLFVLLLAARSVFANSGRIATGIGRAALALTVSLAFLFVFLCVASYIESSRASKVRANAGSAGINRRYVVQMGPQGQPWLGREDDSRQDGDYELTQAAKMEIGRSVRDQLQPIAEDWKKTPSWLVDLGYTYYGEGVRGFWIRFTRLASARSSGSAGFVRREWVLDHKSDTILVYHLTLSGEWQLARRLRAPGPVGSFGEVLRYGQCDTDGNFTLVTSTGAFYVPGDGSAIITMYQTPTSSTILVSAEQPREEEEPFTMMLRLANRVVLLESDLDEIAASRARPIGEVGNIGSVYATEIHVPNELAASKSLGIARDPVRDGAYLGLAQSGYPTERRILWARFDAHGQIAAQQQYIVNTSSDNLYGGTALYASMPPGVWALATSIGLIATDDFSIAKAWGETWKFAKEDPARVALGALLFLLQPIVGVPLAIWAARRRRLDKRQTWLCIAWGFLLGPAGSLSVLAVYPRITRGRCISCQHLTRIDLDHCEHCRHPADELPKIGIEIFGRDTLAASKPAETISSC